MKRVLSVIGLMVLFILGGCSQKNYTYKNINYTQYEEKKQNLDTFALVIGSSSCTACDAYKVTMDSFIKKYNLEIYFIDLEQLSDEEKKQLKVDINFSYTPTTVFFEKGKMTIYYDRLEGAVSMQTLVNKFTEKGYIK